MTVYFIRLLEQKNLNQPSRTMENYNVEALALKMHSSEKLFRLSYFCSAELRTGTGFEKLKKSRCQRATKCSVALV